MFIGFAFLLLGYIVCYELYPFYVLGDIRSLIERILLYICAFMVGACLAIKR